MTKNNNNNQDLLNRMCKEARKAFADYLLNTKAGCHNIAATYFMRWDYTADACYSFAARNGLRVRKGQVGGM